MVFDEFDRIEENELRVVGVCFESGAENAPGDTLIVKAHFAGSGIISASDFSLAYTKKWEKYPTFPDERNISIIDSTLWLPDSMQFRYKIPEDVFVTENVFGEKDSVLNKLLVNFISLYKETDGGILSNMSEDSLAYIFKMISGVMSKCYLFFHVKSDNGTDLKVGSECIIRYNSLFPDYLPVNNNPVIKWLGVYRVPNKIAEEFSPENPEFAGMYYLSYLYNEFYPDSVVDTIVIDAGFTYFLAGDRGINTYIDSNGQEIHDTTIDIIKIEIGNTIIQSKELYRYQWFYQNLDNVSTEPDSLLVLNSSETWPSLTKIETPFNIEMKNFRIWLMLYDDFTGKWDSPKGYAMRTVDGVFEYTDAYIGSLYKD